MPRTDNLADPTVRTRRSFLKIAASVGAAVVVAGAKAIGQPLANGRPQWLIGCFNRPWSAWRYNDALDGMKAAGFSHTGLLGDHAGELFTAPNATNEYLADLRQRIEARKLALHVAWLKTDHSQPVREAVLAGRVQIDHAHRLGAKFLLSTGVEQPDRFEHYYQVMSQLASYAADKAMQVAVKPHGGCSATADEMLRTIDRVNKANFRIWYDAGNIVHYSGADPVADVARVAELVVGFSAKDCGQRGGEVMLQFGEGKVDFRSVFQQLKASHFNGPVMVECCRGSSLAELTKNAAANREYLEQLFASL